MSDTQPAMCYPSERQYGRWKQKADDNGMSVSEFMQAMIEAGIKQLEDISIEPDETRRELRQDRNEYKQRWETAQQRIEHLESRTNTAERQTIIDFVHDEQSVQLDQIVNEVSSTAGVRVRNHLDVLLGDEIATDGAYYHPIDEDD